MAAGQIKTNTRTIERSVLIRADADDIFEALIDPEELVNWFPEKATTDAELGGVLEFYWNNLKGWEYKRGIYTDIIPGTLLSFTWPVGDLNKYTLVSFYFYSQDHYTTVIFSHSDFEESPEWDQEYEEHSRMWTFFLENLKSYMEEGLDKRQELLFKIAAE